MIMTTCFKSSRSVYVLVLLIQYLKNGVVHLTKNDMAYARGTP